MDPTSHERFRLADAVFDAALDLPTGERAAFVDRECGNDTGLGATVGRLLAAHERVDGFLGTSAAMIAAPLLDPPVFPLRVGPFRVVREIGHGGMGTVYLAEREDGEFRQRVALKLIRGGIATDYLVRPFLEERRILASLDHPGIARLIDGGITSDGLPYFAMEHVEGKPIDRYCDERGLPVERRLELFCTVCEAVQHAHRNLVVHCDLKPSNVLVAGNGQVKLLDFGIARLLGAEAEEGLMGTGMRLMTPEYASPEQIRGDAVTTASDVHALGVLLYEVLAGRHPFSRPGLSRAEVERRVLGGEPEPPSTAAPEPRRHRLRGDLDTIVLKAVHREPERRYATAEQLAADVRRHLGGLPVEARPDTRGVPGKHLSPAEPAGSGRGRRVRAPARRLERGGHSEAARIRAQAERIAQANQQTEQVAALLTELFSVPDPGHARGQRVTARELLDRGMERAEALFREVLAMRHRLFGPRHPTVVESLNGLGFVLRGWGADAEAEAVYREALATGRAVFRGAHLDVADALNGLRTALSDQGRFEDGVRAYGEALEMYLALVGEDHPETGVVLLDLGRTLSGKGDLQEAEVNLRRAADLSMHVQGDRHPAYALNLTMLADLLRSSGEPLALPSHALHNQVGALRRLSSKAAGFLPRSRSILTGCCPALRGAGQRNASGRRIRNHGACETDRVVIGRGDSYGIRTGARLMLSSDARNKAVFSGLPHSS